MYEEFEPQYNPAALPPLPFLLAEQIPIEHLELQMRLAMEADNKNPGIEQLDKAWAQVELGLRQPNDTYSTYNFTASQELTQSTTVPPELMQADTRILRAFLPAFMARRECWQTPRVTMKTRFDIFEGLIDVLRDEPDMNTNEIGRCSVLATQLVTESSKDDLSPILYPASSREQRHPNGVLRYDHDAYTIRNGNKVPIMVRALSKRESRTILPEVLQLPYADIAHASLKAYGIRPRRYPIHTAAEILTEPTPTKEEELVIQAITREISSQIEAHAKLLVEE